MAKSWEKLEKQYEDFCKMPMLPIAQKLPANHVIDEDKSVRWNREEVERRNNARQDEIKRLQKSRNEAHIKFEADLTAYIMDYLKVPKEKAEKIVTYMVYTWQDRELFERDDQVFELLDLLNNLIK